MKPVRLIMATVTIGVALIASTTAGISSAHGATTSTLANADSAATQVLPPPAPALPSLSCDPETGSGCGCAYPDPQNCLPCSVDQCQADVDNATSPADSTFATGGSRADGAYDTGAPCVYLVTGVSGRLVMGDSGDGSDGTCGASASTFTYYVGAPNSWGETNPTYPNGSTNGHILEVVSNALRVGEYACGNIYAKSKADRIISGTYNGLCGMPAGTDLYQTGYDVIGSSYCDGHPGGPTNPGVPAKGRCRYGYVRH